MIKPTPEILTALELCPVEFPDAGGIVRRVSHERDTLVLRSFWQRESCGYTYLAWFEAAALMEKCWREKLAALGIEVSMPDGISDRTRRSVYRQGGMWLGLNGRWTNHPCYIALFPSDIEALAAAILATMGPAVQR